MKFDFQHEGSRIEFETTDPAVVLRVSLDYQKGGRRGYVVTMLPIRREVRPEGYVAESFDLWKVRRVQVSQCARKSSKAEKAAIAWANSNEVQFYLNQIALALQSEGGFIVKEGF